MERPAGATATAEREFTLARSFDAPRELIWQAWTEAQHVAKWWGQNGFTNTVHEMNVRPGGAWRLTMHGPDGTDYPVRIIFRQVVPPERLVFDHDDGKGGTAFQVTVTFEDQSGATKLTMHSLFASKEERDIVVENGGREGGPQMLERLAEYVKTL